MSEMVLEMVLEMVSEMVLEMVSEMLPVALVFSMHESELPYHYRTRS